MGPETQVRLAAGSVCPSVFFGKRTGGSMHSRYTTIKEIISLLSYALFFAALMLVALLAGSLPILT